MVVCCYTQGKVLRLLSDDSSHKENSSRYAYSPDTTCDIYASNNNNNNNNNNKSLFHKINTYPMLQKLMVKSKLHYMN